MKDSGRDQLGREGLTALIEVADNALLHVAGSGQVNLWNRAADRLFQADLSLSPPIESLFSPSSKEEITELRTRAMAGERIERHEAIALGRGGAPVPVTLSAVPVRGDGGVSSVAVSLTDISERLEAQRTLEESEARQNEGQALAHIGSWTWDLRSGAVQWSEEMHQIHGIDPSHFGGSFGDHVQTIAPTDRDRVEASMQDTRLQTGNLEIEYEVHRPDGVARRVFVRAQRLVGPEGEAIGLTGICQDVTDRYNANQALLGALDRERAAAHHLRMADELKDEFLATVSHEMRTPLTAIIGFTELISSTATGPQADFVERLERNAQEMRQMVERILDFSRLEAGNVSFHPQEIELRPAVDSYLLNLSAAIGNRPLKVAIEDGLTARADPHGLDRILVNLVANAVKFSPPEAPISISATRVDGMVSVSVTDRGRGIPAELLDRIFDRFFQAPDQPAGRRGTGVGLSIAKRYVELHGGDIRCESVVGQGTTFTFTLEPWKAP